MVNVVSLKVATLSLLSGCGGAVPRQAHTLKAPCKSDTRYLAIELPFDFQQAVVKQIHLLA